MGNSQDRPPPHDPSVEIGTARSSASEQARDNSIPRSDNAQSTARSRDPAHNPADLDPHMDTGPQNSRPVAKPSADPSSGRSSSRDDGTQVASSPRAGSAPDGQHGKLANPVRHVPMPKGNRGGGKTAPGNNADVPVYGALDLGTNNCRLLLARPTRRGFRVIDAFSRIIRLGEGVAQTGQLSDAAMRRTYDALKVCAGKLARNGVKRSRLVATEACRLASNGEAFIERVRTDLGLDIEILTPETEARLAVSGCASLIDSRCDYVLVFDIGGGSSEIIWLDINRLPGLNGRTLDRVDAQNCMVAWTSLPVGVVTLAEHFGGRFVTEDLFEKMVEHVEDMLRPFETEHRFQERLRGSLNAFSRHIGNRHNGCRDSARAAALRPQPRRWVLADG